MPQKYVILDGAAYQPGSAAYKKALQLSAAMPKQSTSTSEAQSILAPYAPKASAAPTSFPSYPMGGGTAGNLAGSPGMPGQGAFGYVPQIPNPTFTAGEAIAGNTANIPALSTLGTETTGLSARLAQQPFIQNLPNYLGNLSAQATNVGSNLAGVIGPSTTNALTRAAAERGVRLGMSPSSPNALTGWLGVLGNTSEQLQALGGQQLNQMIASTPTGQPFNVAGQQINPTDMQAARYAANVAAAAPDPTQAAQANLDMLLQAIRAGQAGGLGGMGGIGPRSLGGGGVLSPVSAGYPGFNMPYYGMTTAPGQPNPARPFYRTGGAQAASPQDEYDFQLYNYPGAVPPGQETQIPQYWPEGMQGEYAGEIPQYEPEWNFEDPTAYDFYNYGY